MKRLRTPTKKTVAEKQRPWAGLLVPPLLSATAGLWLLLLSTTPFFLVERIPLVDTPDRSLLGAGNVWNPWLASAMANQNAMELPFWLGTLVVAVLLGSAVLRAIQSAHWTILLLTVLGLTSIAPWRTTLLTILCTWLTAELAVRARRVAERPAHSIWQVVSCAALVYVLAALTSLEFGLIAICLSLLVILPAVGVEYQTRRQLGVASSVLIVWAALTLFPGLFFHGYFSAMARPISWIVLRPSTELLPSMCPAWQAPDFGWIQWLALALPLERWRQAVQGRLPWSDTLLLALLTVMLVGCSRFTWLATFAMLMASQFDLTPAISSDASKKRPVHLAATATLLLGVAVSVWQLVGNGITVLASDTIQRRIDIAQWKVSGTVLLTNLEQSSDWQHPELNSRYQPVLTDRWDAFHMHYDEYLAVCHEWRNWQREAYLRSSGQWGGYQHIFSQWKPVLVVVDSTDLSAIHRVSLDSKWKPIGIDHLRTIFASAEAQSTNPYVRFANQTLLTLEIPRPMASLEFARVVALGSASDARQVSAVLTSMRLPFAGSRVLPQDLGAGNATVSIFAQSELGHRSQRYSGHFSLLDGARALGNREPLRGSASLITQTHRYRTTLAHLLDQFQAQLLQAQLHDQVAPAAHSIEQQVRYHLASGQLELAIELIPQLANQEKSIFYTTLANVQHQTALQLLASFQAALLQITTDNIASECNYYIGCLAVEVGDVALAQNSLSTSLELEPDSPFSAIAQFYLSQMNP